MRRIAAAVTVAAFGAMLAAPSGAGANPVPQCVRDLAQNAPGFVLYTVQSGQLPRLMGPWTTC